MKIQLASDLHLEFYYPDQVLGYIRSFDPTDVDVLVLAGDICTFRGGFFNAIIKEFCALYPKVVFVPGNHEYYNIAHVNDGCEAACDAADQNPNFYPLFNNSAILDGVAFYGGTMWFPKPTPEQARWKLSMSDFRVIPSFEPWVYNQHKAFVKGLGKADVVVSHHLPSSLSTPPEYQDSPLNCYFSVDMHKAIARHKPKLWLHGHTHGACDYRLHDTRVVCNPRGYPGEGVVSDPKKVVEI